MSDGDDPTAPQDPTDEAVVETVASAAEDVIFSRLDSDEIRDYDVTVSFEDDVLELDVYVNADTPGEDPEQVAEDAVLAGRTAADDLLEG